MTWRRAATLGISAFIAIASAACDDSGRYTILRRPPFFQTEAPLEDGRDQRVLSEVKGFAADHRMVFTSAEGAFPPGQFNASAEGPHLNLRAMHVLPSQKGVTIFAYSDQAPTASDRAMVGEFVARISAAASGRRPHS